LLTALPNHIQSGGLTLGGVAVRIGAHAQQLHFGDRAVRVQTGGP
jgi:hypothetical protein